MKIDWTTFKAELSSRSMSGQYIQDDNNYYLKANDDWFALECILDKSPSDTTDLDDFEDNYKTSFNKKINRLSTTTHRPEVQVMKPEGSSATKVTHDWCDKTTWAQESTEITTETMTDSGDGLTFNSANTYWIDLTHGKMYDEYNIADKKEPVIYDNAVAVTTGFTINYSTGDVTFSSAPTGPVTCDYWYAGSSSWTLGPTAGKALFIEHAELNFSADVMISSPFTFQIWVYNPADLPNKVPYQTIKYKNIKDIINAANLGQGYIPKLSGLTENIMVFPFNYATVKPLQSSFGAELRVSVDGDAEVTGEWSTATFYVLSEAE